MGWLQTLIGKGTGSIVEKGAEAIAKISAGHLGKKELVLELQKIADAEAARMSAEATAEIQAKERIMVAEMQQGDNYTKRARPTVVYMGLAVIAWNYALIPTITGLYATFWSGASAKMQPMDLPMEFWMAWSAVVGIYSIGRSAEKRGWNGKLTAAVTGTPKAPSIL